VSTPISIVMPVYNESGVIADVVAELTRDVLDRLDGTEIVMVDDGSTDGTPAILDRLAAADPERVRVIHAERNAGHGPSLRAAFESAEGEWLFQMDSDGQQVAAELWDLWALRERADLVVGVRRGRSEGRHRDVVSAAARAATRVVGGGRLRDVNAPFKLIRREVWEDLRGDVPAVPVAPSLLIAVGAAVRGWRVAEVEVSHLPRRAGSSTVDLRLLARLTAGALRELIGFRLRLRRRDPLAASAPASSRSASATPAP
jgi:dolichol-phosphate mannosyltransferase